MPNTDKHPQYGPCDQLAASGQCSECRKMGLATPPAVNVEPTAKTLDEMSDKFAELSLKMRDHAKMVRESGDLTYVQEAISAVTAGFAALRLDLLAARPLRELYKKIEQ